MTVTTELARQQDVGQPANDLLSVISLAVRDPTVDVGKMKELLAMKFLVDERNAKAAFFAAKAKLQERLPRVHRDGIIPLSGGKGIKFAMLEDIQAVVNPLLREFHFSTSYDEQVIDGGLKKVICWLSHTEPGAECSHSEPYTAHVPLEDQGPGRNRTQGMISSNSYGKRRALINALDIQIGGEDDDGNAGSAEPIDEKQTEHIRALMHEFSVKEINFLKFMQVDSVGKITKGRYEKAIAALEAKRPR